MSGSVVAAEKKVILLTPRGFCAGVVRAIDVVKIALDVYGPPIYVRKEIVHNRHVVEDLRTSGAIFVEEVAEVPEGSRVIFSAHGVSPEVRRDAIERRLEVIDATCPLVTKVHLEAVRFARRGYTILLIGQFDHWVTPYAKDLKLASLNSLSDMSLKLTDSTGSGADITRVKVYRDGNPR